MKPCWVPAIQPEKTRRDTSLAGIIFTLLLVAPFSFSHAASEDPYLEPGSVRLSHTLSLEGVFHKSMDNVDILNSGENKTYVPNGRGTNAWESEWGQNLLTEVATRLSKSAAARVLFNMQGEYADRYWRPVNYDHYQNEKGNHVYLRQAEAKIDEEDWYIQGFSGVSHNGWSDKGDLFDFYTGIYPERDYLGSSGYFGVYPQNWRQDQYQNISNRKIPQGGEAGGKLGNFDGAVAYGNELDWGYNHNAYGRVAAALGSSQLTFLYKDQDVPYLNTSHVNERDQAYALTWVKPSEEGWDVNVGALYEPFRIGDTYLADRSVSGGSGLLGSSHSISTETVKRSDALGGKLVLDGNLPIPAYPIKTQLKYERRGVVAGNKEEFGLRLGSDFGSNIQGFVNYVYRRPLEGPIPFLYEGTPDNILSIAANPRGPESPFAVDWTNRKAVFLTTTINFDLTPGTNMYLYDPTNIALWNLNPAEDARLAISFQHRMSDYKTTTDRQTYHDESGNIIWESYGYPGAWANNHPLHEFRVLGHGKEERWKWSVGFAGGQSPAVLGLAYSTSTALNKPITEYVSFEFKVERGAFATWGHYGTGVWGPEENIHPFLGESYDRIFGLGVSYNINRHTTWDISYLGARQNDNLFRPPHLGSFDEIRTVFSHRFGFLFLFDSPSRAGTRVR